ncbi:MAG: adenylate kinase [Chitinophagales bacterium]|nr:adenylate kinase [Chitinophagales bacterium]MDW8393302.1 adenylate kinase [Chitinophagales bacterium]
MMTNLVLFGPPGSGKGTQAALLRNRYHLLHLSTGDVFRRELQNNSSLGREVRSYLDQGLLVPDQLTFQVLLAEIDRHKQDAFRGLLFDGYPRTLAQAEMLHTYLQKINQPLNAVLLLEVSDEEVIRRIQLRGASSGRTDDTSDEIIRNRLRVYYSQTLPLVDYYRQQGILHAVAGEGSVEEIHQRLCDIADRFFS